MRINVLGISLFVLLILSIISIYFLWIKGDEKSKFLNMKIIELEAKSRVEFLINTHSELSYPQILNSLGKLEKMLINKGLIEEANSEHYQKLYKEFGSLEGKFEKDEIKEIPNYYELTKPYIMAVVVKSYYNVMVDLDYDHFNLTIREFSKYLKSEPNINFDHLFVNIDKMNVEGDLLRIFMLLQIIQNI